MHETIINPTYNRERDRWLRIFTSTGMDHQRAERRAHDYAVSIALQEQREGPRRDTDNRGTKG